MIDERQQELASLYALDLLEGAERAEFEARLAGEPALRTLVDELREASTRLALQAPQFAPRPALKSRVMDRIGSRATTPRTAQRFAFPVFLPWAIAACLAVACGVVAQLYVSSKSRASLLEQQQALADIELRSVQQQLEAERILAQRQQSDSTAAISERDQRIAELDRANATATRSAEQIRDQLAAAEVEIHTLRDRLQAEADLANLKIATLASLAGNSPEALAVAVWNPNRQEGVLRVSKLPALATDKDYQLWVIDPAYETPVDSGVFSVDPATGEARITFRPTKPIKSASKFAVSLEQKGGVSAPAGPILLLGD